MGVRVALFDSFAAGEITPKLRGRTSSTAYKQGLANCENFIPDPRGPLYRRPPLVFISRFTSVSAANIHGIAVSQGEAYTILFVDSNAHIIREGYATVTLASPYLAADLSGLYKVELVQRPDNTSAYIVHPNYIPYKLSLSSGTWTLAAVAFVATPSAWTTGSGNYPTTMTFFQGRTVWAGCAADPSSLWFSRSASYEDLTLGTLASDGLKETIAAAGRIMWVSGVKNLLVGTETGEYVITSDAGVITPSDVHAEQQSAYGSKAVAAQFIGNEALYVSPDGLKLRTMWYAWTDSGWVSRDLTEASDHITVGGIRDVAFSRNPDSIAWMATEDGKLIGCSYRRAAGDNTPIVGWHRHPLVDGTVLSIATIERNGTSYLWAAVKNNVGGADEVQVCRFDMAASHFFLDAVKAVTLSPAGSTVTGLDHLEGKTVGVMADGSVHPDCVVTGGQITLSVTAAAVEVGYRTIAFAETLPLVIETVGSKPASYLLKQWSRAFLRIYDSAKPVVFGSRPPARTPTMLMDTPVPNGTEDVQVSSLGWDRFGSVTITQDLPLPTTVVSVAGETSVEG